MADTNSEWHACTSRVTKCYLERPHLAWVALSLETFVSHKSALTRNAAMYFMYSVPEGMAVGGIGTMMKELKRHAADLGRNKFHSHQLYVRNERRTNPEVGRLLSWLWAGESERGKDRHDVRQRPIADRALISSPSQLSQQTANHELLLCAAYGARKTWNEQLEFVKYPSVLPTDISDSYLHGIFRANYDLLERCDGDNTSRAMVAQLSLSSPRSICSQSLDCTRVTQVDLSVARAAPHRR